MFPLCTDAAAVPDGQLLVVKCNSKTDCPGANWAWFAMRYVGNVEVKVAKIAPARGNSIEYAVNT